ncbi:type II toxin-antitoxin system antitoxin SocA domain-containing protein [Leptospira sp. SA-E8]|uniref:type II toxin-antitoxin system antitoxin SocA domain-containing protein n=1 Tax=Leptospira sp. SA-E8 TaxID=3422259 RepID=UPI003EBD9AD7
MKAIKLLFFADRYHIRKFGTPITYDDYFAIQHGPIQSTTKNMLTLEEFYLLNQLDEESSEFIRNNIHTHVQSNKYEVEILNPEKDSLVSRSEQNSIEFSLSSFFHFDQYELAKITHDYPEWKKFESFFNADLNTRKCMTYLDFFKNPIIDESPFIKKYLKGEDLFYEDEETMDIMRDDFIINHPDLFLEMKENANIIKSIDSPS